MNDSIGAPTVDVEDQVRQMGAMPNATSNSDDDQELHISSDHQ